MERNPHLLFEGCLIGCWAIGAKVAYIYIRGEFYHVQRDPRARARQGATRQGYVGKNIMGTGFDCDIVIHRGAGAYEAGEETALIESLEGQARAAAHQAAVSRRRRASTTARRRSTTSRRSATCRAIIDATARSGSRARPGEERRAEAVLRQRPREEAGRLRSVDEDDAARADLRLCRRHPRRPPAEGGHSRRIVGADPAARSARHPGELRRRGRRRDRCWDRPASS